MSAHSTLDIRLQGKDYRVTCSPEEQDALTAAVSFLDGKMTEIGALTKSTGERLAVMAALNIVHELLALRQSPSTGESIATGAIDDPGLGRRIRGIEARLDAALAQQQQEGLF
ncbi:cell division protein ZapA [Denitratisoma oestradiolicum]|uniref:Cell division protein ZapA n=1 Tax=Denitratisoma oestradiolicum TaxID=311182 RepID=A0A6S6YRE8_9PROT|nr:cell division protein ZapA [Denitratisoma oestradiolicum]TWO78950.1 hypothetical protein CBW56_17480 [Denitratisoma oestradiolicum]CAB1370332.1 Cell division protein ZapA [Denitratisoma oestradiolicum]